MQHDSVQAADFFDDQDLVQKLCPNAGDWLLGYTSEALKQVYHADEQLSASDLPPLSEDRMKV
jgi:hypothetical protein